jgi:hypothetical protein
MVKYGIAKLINNEEEYLMITYDGRRWFTHSWDTIEDALMLESISDMPKLVDNEYYVKISILQGLDELNPHQYSYCVEKYEAL